MIHLKDCSRENLIRVIAKMTDSVGKFSNYNTGYDEETCELLNSIGSQAIKECDIIGWSIEEKSKLEWEKNPPEKPMSWYDAVKYSDSLNTMSEHGWRLPTVEELKEAYDNKIEGFESSLYWSSSIYSPNTNSAWNVSFYNGVVNYYYKTNNFLYVRCVREVK